MKNKKIILDFDIHRIEGKNPTKSEKVLSNIKYNHEYYIEEIILRQYIENYDTKLGNYYLFILYVKTNKGIVLMKYDEGYRGVDSFESTIEFIKKYTGVSSLLNRAIIELEFS
jgi:hypothetical protein